MLTTKDIGDWGEEQASQFLQTKGFEIQHRNWRSGRYELDIVATKDDTLHFIEVKCRKKDSLTTAQDAITETKSQSLFAAAEAYIEKYGIDLEIQFDLVSVEYDMECIGIEYVPDAILPRW